MLYSSFKFRTLSPSFFPAQVACTGFQTLVQGSSRIQVWHGWGQRCYLGSIVSVFSRSPPKTLVIIGRPGRLHSFSHSTLLSLKQFKSFLYIKTMAGFWATLKRTLYPHINILPNKSMVNLQDVDQMHETGKTTTYRSQRMGLFKYPNRLNPILILKVQNGK